MLYSVDFDEIEKYQSSGEWDKSAAVLGDAAANLEKAGADFILICTNTMHKVADAVQKRISVPILHIAEITADVLKSEGIKKVGLLGTKYTMTQDFYKAKLIEAGIEVVIPDEAEVEMINDVIFNQLCLGIISEESRTKFVQAIEQLKTKGAQGVILGCTEIGLLIEQKDSALPVFDTTLIHAEKAALLSLN